MCDRVFATYILASASRRALYVGVTGHLPRRLLEHRLCRDPRSFTSRYRVTRLVWYEFYGDASLAIAREKQIKAGSRERKLRLIDRRNPGWRDLSDEVLPPGRLGDGDRDA
ncbi:MAG: GIY-YIG nuclease family protein [Gemmatimonadales bacterium]|nr:GIY-YIG nuclease family protein [Gemmatimonadales bacterium]